MLFSKRERKFSNLRRPSINSKFLPAKDPSKICSSFRPNHFRPKVILCSRFKIGTLFSIKLPSGHAGPIEFDQVDVILDIEIFLNAFTFIRFQSYKSSLWNQLQCCESHKINQTVSRLRQGRIILLGTLGRPRALSC